MLVLRRENALLRRQVKRVRYEPADRVWPAALSRLIPRRRWAQVFGVSPDTLVRWRRRLVAWRWRHPRRAARADRLRRSAGWWMARQNPGWGRRPILGGLINEYEAA